MAKRQALRAGEAPLRPSTLTFPAAVADRLGGRLGGLQRRTLSDPFGLTQVGVYQTRLAPGATSGLHHRHSRREEFIYVLSGEATLVGDEGEQVLTAGMCAGFPPGSAHHLENRGTGELVYLDITHPAPGDVTEFPREDLVLSDEGGPVFRRSDGTPV